MNRTLKTRTRRLEQASAASDEKLYYPVIRATDTADADRQMEALYASGALDGWGDRPIPVVRIIGRKPEEPNAA
ncbi:hypothetical protein [Microvirga sp. VF16]|uniref:hypothetical protein n=1 Tax=Microvirga sp. VF16 TaxID=2807101 RepID=UPI00193D6A5C|nr:hypothetical protein [Microvirga sp. VF16]QRM27351.1 hypothetical protein JO965_13675 [Microvirga sp. VF16]